MKKHFWSFTFSAIALVACGKKAEPPVAAAPATPAASAPAPVAAAEEKLLNIYNWPDYIAKDMVANFEKESGIKVNYQTFENNEALQAKLVAGPGSGSPVPLWRRGIRPLAARDRCRRPAIRD